ncbi:MAG: hypothetical protein LIP03_14280 [Bacteroidales bacterium]|nr:hypothetical protein [Bacteroidales bacterium]
MSAHNTDDWYCLRISPQQTNKVAAALRDKFTVFVPQGEFVWREDNKMKKGVRNLINGMVFVQGEYEEPMRVLKAKGMEPWMHHDPATDRPAKVPDEYMQRFMLLCNVRDREVCFLVHPYSTYAQGNSYVKITAGVFEGWEGYVVRFHRDRKLVVQLGEMVVAITGVLKDGFVNAGQYLSERDQEGMKEGEMAYGNRPADFAAILADIEKYGQRRKAMLKLKGLDYIERRDKEFSRQQRRRISPFPGKEQTILRKALDDALAPPTP